MKYLIIGLGNIGATYEQTRHNVGFMVLDRLAKQQEASFTVGRLASEAHFSYRGRTLHLIKPTTYMNLSGRAVRYWTDKLKLPLNNILVITDDLALPFGKLRLRAKGSPGGHNGLKSIEESLGTSSYPRLRWGISNNFTQGNQAAHVLADFTEEELSQIGPALDNACQAARSWCTIGLAHTMNQWNK